MHAYKSFSAFRFVFLSSQQHSTSDKVGNQEARATQGNQQAAKQDE